MSRLLSVAVWGAVAAAGAAAVLVSALHRGESINALWIVTAGLCSFAIAYRFYSKWLAVKVLAIDDRRAPPSITERDGKDFVPTNTWVVYGHHFAAIAGPGPLVGPVLAAQFGYLPGMLWILVGATLGGGVHDAVILFASMRRCGRSLGQMLKEEVNPVVGVIALVSLLAIMTILLAVLGLVVVKALAESPWGLFTIAMTIPLALAMGLAHTVGKVSVRTVTVFGVTALLASVWGGSQLGAWGLTPWFDRGAEWIAWAIILYGFAASVLPVWLLLAPRDYLSTYMKLGTVAVLAAAIVIVAPPLHMPALTRYVGGTGPVFAGPVFPFVFITIACGAVSGFHALISSGTTPKMASRESVVRSVGYGAMITEMLVAIMALVAASALQPGQYFAINAGINKTQAPAAVVEAVTAAGFPVTVAEMDRIAADVGEKTMFGRTGGAPTFALGMARMFAKAFGEGWMALWYHFAIMFEALFILTTIDAGTRVGRFVLQDFLGQMWAPLGDTRSWPANVLASGLIVGAWGYFLYQGVVDPMGGINTLWPLFGIANQLLAVIAFALGTTILIKMGRTRYAWVTAVPLAFLIAVTFSAGLIKIFSPDPALGFLAGARHFAGLAADGGPPAQAALWQRTVAMNQLDAAVAGLFLLFVAVIVAGCARDWFRMLRGRKPIELRECPYVPMPEQV
ncbi:MAG TPA: carbon starvation CstA family protein [Vicinamibacterales bacterium]|nr:carbon starvation CstA family protein [Vicinamibacterales bacterium]HPW19767.1 carbon starvation CstA family protein [Vicinamibacterales bacterium]